MTDLPIIKNINVKSFLTVKEAEETIEHLKLMLEIEKKRQQEITRERVLHIL